MNTKEDMIEKSEPVLSWPWLVVSLLGILVVAVTITTWLPGLAPQLANTLLTDNPKAFWYLSRGTAIVAFILIWASMLTGLLITNKMARAWPGGPVAFDLHEYLSIIGLAFGLFHGLILMGDHYIGYNLAQVLLPFASFGYKPFWVGLGQISMYLTGILVASFYVRKTIAPKTWRLIHFVSFLTFLMVLVHGVASGTDSPAGWMQLIYWGSAASLVFLTVYRIVLPRVLKQARGETALVKKGA